MNKETIGLFIGHLHLLHGLRSIRMVKISHVVGRENTGVLDFFL